MAGGLGSIAGTLQGIDPLTLAQALAAQQQQELAQNTQQATQAAAQAGQQYQQAAQSPAPELDPFSQLLPALFGDVGAILAGNPALGERGHQQVQQSRAELLKARADNLAGLMQSAKARAEAAQKAGDFEAETKARTTLDSIHQKYDVVKQNADHAATLEEIKARGEQDRLTNAAKPPAVGGGGVYGQAFSQTDPVAIAKGIENGDLSPNLSQYSRLAQGPIATQLAKDGFKLAKAQQDFSAVQRHFATLNGRLQLQIRQSATTVSRGLDDVVELATKLNQLAPSTGATPINRLIVKGSREWGALGPEAQNIATELNGQIATLIPELSNIYSAGGVPTTEAMKLAERTMNAEWPLNRILAGVRREKANIQYRVNSINSVGAVTPSSTETAPFESAPGPVSVTAPNGKTYHFASQQQADIFKKRAGIQ